MTTEILSNFQAESIDYLYDIEPQSQNLFWAGEFNEVGSEGKEGGKNVFWNAAFRIRKIEIPMPKMEVDQNVIMKTSFFKNINYAQEVSIEWFEDVYHSVLKYHTDWIARWYDRRYDVLRCGPQGKYRKLRLVAFHYKDTQDNNIIPAPVIQPIMEFKITGLIPTDIPPLVFDYSADQNDQPLSIKYKCNTIEWNYLITEKADLWSPTGFHSDTGAGGEAKTANRENDRLAEAIITRGKKIRIA